MNAVKNLPDQTAERLSVLVFGAGAIGTYIGGNLALHGQRVVFLERPEIAEEIRFKGLRLSQEGADCANATGDCANATGDCANATLEDRLPNPQAVGSLLEALGQGPFDAAIFALKSNDTQAALQMMAPYVSQMPPIVCLQNGVENEPTLAGVLGAERVIPGTVTSAIGRRAPGDIILERRRGMGLVSGHLLSERLAAALNQAGLNAHLYPQAQDMKWSKMLTNLLANASSAILDMTPAEIFANPGLFRLEICQLRETLQVMAAQGIQVIDLPGTPVRLLAFAVRRLPAVISRPLLRRAVGRGRGAKMPSFHIDLHSHRGTSEVDYLNGAVVRFGERLGIATPVNRLLNETLLALTRGETPLSDYARQPEKLINQVVV